MEGKNNGRKDGERDKQRRVGGLGERDGREGERDEGKE